MCWQGIGLSCIALLGEAAKSSAQESTMKEYKESAQELVSHKHSRHWYRKALVSNALGTIITIPIVLWNNEWTGGFQMMTSNWRVFLFGIAYFSIGYVASTAQMGWNGAFMIDSLLFSSDPDFGLVVWISSGFFQKGSECGVVLHCFSQASFTLAHFWRTVLFWWHFTSTVHKIQVPTNEIEKLLLTNAELVETQFPLTRPTWTIAKNSYFCLLYLLHPNAFFQYNRLRERSMLVIG